MPFSRLTLSCQWAGELRISGFGAWAWAVDRELPQNLVVRPRKFRARCQAAVGTAWTGSSSR